MKIYVKKPTAQQLEVIGASKEAFFSFDYFYSDFPCENETEMIKLLTTS